jgi:hypothetical protein
MVERFAITLLGQSTSMSNLGTGGLAGHGQ